MGINQTCSAAGKVAAAQRERADAAAHAGGRPDAEQRGSLADARLQRTRQLQLLRCVPFCCCIYSAAFTYGTPCMQRILQFCAATVQRRAEGQRLLLQGCHRQTSQCRGRSGRRCPTTWGRSLGSPAGRGQVRAVSRRATPILMPFLGPLARNRWQRQWQLLR